MHGFTQTARSWPDSIVSGLADTGHEVVAVDAPGHGSASDVHLDLWDGARRLGVEGGRAAYVGYSMGGRLVLHLAILRPDLIERVVLVGATPGIADEAERAARRTSDEELANGLERDGVDVFLERWMANPLFATLPADAAGLDDRRSNTVAGLAASLRLMGTGVQEPLWDRLAARTMPALFVAGEADEKFAALAREMGRAWGGPAEVALVTGAGHACHLEQPRRFLDAIVTFLQGPTATPTANSAP